MRLFILAFALGVLLLQSAPVLPGGLAGMSLAGVWLLALCHFRTRLTPVCCLLAGLLLGLAWAAWRAEERLAEALPPDWEGRDLVVAGQIVSLPQQVARGERFEFAVDRIETAGAQVPGRLLLSWYLPESSLPESTPADLRQPALRAGERWQFTVRLKRPHGNANPHGFDYEAWLLERKLRATGYVRAGEALPPGTGGLAPGVAIERLRQIIRDGMMARLPAADYPWWGILVALAIGDQRGIETPAWTVLNRTGVQHAFSISGLHVTLIAALAGGLAGRLWRRIPGAPLRWPAQRVASLAAWAMALFYTALAGFAVPAQRTLYMLSVAVLAIHLGRTVAPSRTLALALAAVLLLDPWAVLSAGFWLSFAAVAALLYVGAARPGGAGRWRDRVADWGLAQWAATLVSLPILLLLFQQFSLVSPLANAFTMPVISLLVTPLALLGAIFPGAPFLPLAHAVLDVLMALLARLADWPVWQSAAPPLWATWLALGGVGLLLLPVGVPGRWLGLLWILPAMWPPLTAIAPGEARFVLLDVGQGLASVIQTRHHTLIYDPGPRYSAESNAGQRVLVPYLRALGVERVDRLIVTHRDSDHAGGTAAVLDSLTVDSIRSSMPELDAPPCLAGERWTWDGVDFELLYPLAAVDPQRKSNHASCVLRVTAGGRRLLLTADIEAEDERMLVARHGEDLAADVLLVPHHGSRTSSTAAFLAAVAPRIGLIPVGYRNRFGHPKAEVLARYEQRGVRLWRTDRDGALIVDLGPAGVGVRAWREERRRYWHGR